MIQSVVTSFWRKWQRDYFSTLLVRQKWHVDRRNLKRGDIVLVPESNTFRGQWKMAEVLEAEPGVDGKVRDVTLRYKVQEQRNRNGRVDKYVGQPDKIINRSVHRLVLLLESEDNTNDDIGGGSVPVGSEV